MSRWVNGNVNELWLVSERRKVKAADIPDIDIMRFIKERSMEEKTPGGWVAHSLPRWVFSWDFEDGPWSHLPWKVVVAKLDKLERRGLITSCMCGCRMDIEITEKGQRLLNAHDLVENPAVRLLVDAVAEEMGRAFDRYPPHIAEAILHKMHEQVRLRPTPEVGSQP